MQEGPEIGEESQKDWVQSELSCPKIQPDTLTKHTDETH